MLACVWGGDRYAWGSAAILGLLGAAAALGALLVLRERRVADPVVPLDLLRTRTVALASAALFVATATLFSINVFVPLFLQVTTGAIADARPGCCSCPRCSASRSRPTSPAARSRGRAATAPTPPPAWR